MPPLPKAGAAADLTPSQQRTMVGAIVALHVAGGYALMQVDAVRAVVLEAAPMFVRTITAPEPPAPPPPPSKPQPQTKRPDPPPAIVTTAPSPAPATFVVPAPPPEPAAPTLPSPPAPPAVVAVAAPAPPVAPPAPKVVPASAVEYLVPPAPVYPRLSMRQNEHGRTLVRVYIDQAGQPAQVVLGTTSGHTRLDEAALAAVRKARFKPPTENGQPIEGWASVPIDFNLTPNGAASS